MSYHIYSQGYYLPDVNEMLELHNLLCKYHEKITGRLEKDQENLKEWFSKLLNKAPSSELLLRAARALERHKNDKYYVLREEDILAIGTD